MVCNICSPLTYCCLVCRAFNFVCTFLPPHVKDDKLEESKQYCAALKFETILETVALLALNQYKLATEGCKIESIIFRGLGIKTNISINKQ